MTITSEVTYSVIDEFSVRPYGDDNPAYYFYGSLLDCVKYVIKNGLTGKILFTHNHYEILGGMVLPKPDIYDWNVIDLDREVI